MIAHVVETLREGGAVDEIIAVSSSLLPLPTLDAKIVIDRQPALGPLAGIREGLAHMKADIAYTTSTDAPFLTTRFVSAMLDFGEAAAPEVDGYVQTLAAVYPRRALACADELIAQDRLRPLHLLEAVGYRKVSPDELPDIESIRGFNTPEQYLAAARESAPDSTACLEVRGAARKRVSKLDSRSAAAVSAWEWEIPVGTLGEALAHVPGLDVLEGDRLAAPFRVSLGGGESIQDARVPVGPGERVILEDAPG